jgi:uncharacterized protein with NAD-binding domain and iron-sulfur cluster
VTGVAANSQGKGFTVQTRQGSIEVDNVVLAVQHQDVKALLPLEWYARPYFTSLGKLPVNPIVDVFLSYDRAMINERVIAIPGTPALWVITHQVEGKQQLAVSISCPGQLTELSAVEIQYWVEQRLAQALGGTVPGVLVRARVMKHMKATFSAIPAHQGLRPNTSTPIPGLLMAGDFTNTTWPATMEGAVRSGFSAAQAILDQRKKAYILEITS